MSVKIYKNKKDSFVDSQSPTQNFGIDEILELKTITENLHNNSSDKECKILISFDGEEIDSFKSIIENENSQDELILFFASGNNIKENLIVELYGISDEWDNGIGKRDLNFNSNEGLTYEYYVDVLENSETKINETEIDLYDSKDLRFYLPNSNSYSFVLNIKNGNILKNKQELYYFSKDTHTIYSPQLHVKFDDSVFNIPTNWEVVNKKFTLSLKNNSQKFYSDSKYRISILARDSNPVRRFLNSSIFLQKKYLPQNSFYSIRDIDSGYYLINFDETFTKISLDEDGNFFDLYTHNMETNRYYAIDIKVKIDEYEYIVKDSLIFRLYDEDFKLNNLNISYQ